MVSKIKKITSHKTYTLKDTISTSETIMAMARNTQIVDDILKIEKRYIYPSLMTYLLVHNMVRNKNPSEQHVNPQKMEAKVVLSHKLN